MDETHVNPTRAQVTHAEAPLPFIVVKTAGGWLVKATPVIASRKRIAAQASGAPSLKATWTGDNDSKLGKAEVFGRFEFQPPADFAPGRTSAAMAAWESPARGDAPGTQLIAMVQDVDPDNPPKNADDAAREALSGVEFKFTPGGPQPQYDEWAVSAFERGKIDGVAFVRARWAGIRSNNAPEKFRGRKMHGIFYLTLEGGRVQWFLAQDFEPYYHESLHECESAILRMRSTAGK